MPTSVPQPILDALTDVAMPRLADEPPADEHVAVAGARVPVWNFGALVVGSGAAGLRAAVELKRRGVDVGIITQSAYGGTSACSGSDKQTLHTANSADRGDNFQNLAEALGAGGGMDEDTAYVEAVGSARALASLQYLGLPVPSDPFGGVLRYQTDHDEVGRATSCGPRTSRLMVQALAREAIGLGVPIFNQTTAARILVSGARARGVLAMQPTRRADDNPLGFAAFHADHLVLAAGGPGELYRDSVYPRNCFGALGLALQAGIEAVNLTESQFGIGTPRDGFPWNLSGTYAQAMPYVYSLDAQGTERNFLGDYYRTTQELASNIFRKGYQWPFHANRMLDFGSSLFDLAVFAEQRAGRRVVMDFNRNPAPVPGDAPFSLARLDGDVSAYLQKSGAWLATPIARLERMNPLSIELYRAYKLDIAREPLAFAINNQHMNGGLAVDIWGRTSLAGCYAIGEAAGTHGVTRPGGAALNAGQVFGTRCAEHIAAQAAPSGGDARTLVAAAVAEIEAGLRPRSPLTVEKLRGEIQARMSDAAGMICDVRDISAAHAGAVALNAAIAAEGVAAESAASALRAVQWRHMALASEAVLAALDFYVARGGGSRGARALCDPEGANVPLARSGPLVAYRFRPERAADAREQIRLRREGEGFAVCTTPLREKPRGERPFFEADWPAYLTGAIYQEPL